MDSVLLARKAILIVDVPHWPVSAAPPLLPPLLPLPPLQTTAYYFSLFLPFLSSSSRLFSIFLFLSPFSIFLYPRVDTLPSLPLSPHASYLLPIDSTTLHLRKDCTYWLRYSGCCCCCCCCSCCPFHVRLRYHRLSP